FTHAVSARRRGRSNTALQPRTSSAALHKSGFGTKRTYRDDLLIVRFWSRADIVRVRCLLRPTRMTQSRHERAAFAAMHGPDLLYLMPDPWPWVSPSCGWRSARSLVSH